MVLNNCAKLQKKSFIFSQVIAWKLSGDMLTDRPQGFAPTIKYTAPLIYNL